MDGFELLVYAVLAVISALIITGVIGYLVAAHPTRSTTTIEPSAERPDPCKIVRCPLAAGAYTPHRQGILPLRQALFVQVYEVMERIWKGWQFPRHSESDLSAEAFSSATCTPAMWRASLPNTLKLVRRLASNTSSWVFRKLPESA